MINVTKVYLPRRDNLHKYIDRIYSSNVVANNGPLAHELENRLIEATRVPNVVLVGNATLAQQLIIKALNIKTAAVTSFSFVSTVSSLIWEGVTPYFVDINPHCLTVDTSDLNLVLAENSNIESVIGTHVYGNICDVDVIEGIAKRHGLYTIYDAAHCFTVEYGKRSAFAYGDVSFVSFHATKLFHTAEGGAIFTNDDALANELRGMRNFGFVAPDTVARIGINAKINELECAMGLAVMDDLDDIISNRKCCYEAYIENLDPGLIIPKLRRGTMNYSYLPVLLKSEEQMQKVRHGLSTRGINPRRYFFPSLNKLPYLPNSRSCNVAEDISTRVLCLPLFYGLEIENIKLIAEICNDVFYNS